jgi:hypothetical protein
VKTPDGEQFSVNMLTAIRVEEKKLLKKFRKKVTPGIKIHRRDLNPDQQLENMLDPDPH